MRPGPEIGRKLLQQRLMRLGLARAAAGACCGSEGAPPEGKEGKKGKENGREHMYMCCINEKVEYKHNLAGEKYGNIIPHFALYARNIHTNARITYLETGGKQTGPALVLEPIHGKQMVLFAKQ